MYNVEITSEVLEVTAETIEGTTQEHVSFRLRVNSLLDGNLQQNDAENMRLIEQVYTPNEDLEVDGRQSRTFMDRRRSSVFSVADLNIQYPESTIISGKIFCDLFPFHVVFDKDLVIKQCGIKLQKMAGRNLKFYIELACKLIVYPRRASPAVSASVAAAAANAGQL